MLDRIDLFAGELLRVRRVVCCPAHAEATPVEHAESDTLVLPVRGTFVKHLARHRQVLAEPTQALFFAAERAYRVSHPACAGDECLVLQFAPAVAREALADVTLDSFHDHRLRPNAPVPAPALLARAVLGRRLGQGRADPLEVEEIGLRLLALLLRTALTERLADTVRPRTRALRRQQAEAVRSRILADPAAKLTLHGLARETFSTPYHLARVFREETGIAIHQHQLRVRLAHALVLLLDTDAGLGRIALELGFSTHSHFTASFRRLTGMTPGELRREASSATLRKVRTILIDHGAPER